MKINKPTIYLASDSTVQDYDLTFAPQAGWGQMLPNYLSTPIINHAIGGRSSKTFIEEGRLDKILEQIQPGDFLFVQFGHNDATINRPERYVSPEDFPTYIRHYIDGCLLKQATCVLITPVVRRNCDDHGEFRISFQEYRQKIIELGQQYNLPVLDLGKATYEWLSKKTPEDSKNYYMWVSPEQYPGERYKNGMTDNTHLNERGAKAYAKLCVKLILSYSTDHKLDTLKKQSRLQS